MDNMKVPEEELNSESTNLRCEEKMDNMEVAEQTLNSESTNSCCEEKMDNVEVAKQPMNSESTNPSHEEKMDNMEVAKQPMNSESTNPSHEEKMDNMKVAEQALNSKSTNPSCEKKMDNMEVAGQALNPESTNPCCEMKMDNMEVAEQATLNSKSTNPCYEEGKGKNLKLEEAGNALLEAEKLHEQRIDQVEADNANLKKAHQEEQEQMKIEKEKKLKEYNARVSIENEVAALKSEIATLEQKVGANAQDKNMDVKVLQACLSDRETEIKRLKELLEQERTRGNAESRTFEREKMKAAEICKLLEVEKNKSTEKGKQLVRIEAEKAEEYRRLQARLGKEVNEAKMKLASETSKFKGATKRFEAEKQKLLADKRTLVSEMAKVEERIEAEKQRAAQEKKRADAEMIKEQHHKKLAEDNQNKVMNAKLLTDEMYQKLEEDKRTIEELKQKICELSSLTKPNEISGVSKDNAKSAKVQQLEDCLKLEKIREKVAKKKYKLEASQHSNLRQELAHLKQSFTQCFHHLDMLDASFSLVDGNIHGLTKNMPKMQISNLTSEYAVKDIEHDRKRKRDNCVEGGKKMVSYGKDNIQSENDRADKRRKKSQKAKVCTNKGEKKGTKVTSVGVCEGASGFKHPPYTGSYSLRTTQACRERIFDALNNFGSMICFDSVDTDNVMELLGLENVAYGEQYITAMDVQLSPSLPKIKAFEMEPSLEVAFVEDLLSQKDQFPYLLCDVNNVEINSNKKKLDVATGPFDTHHMPAQASKIDANLPQMRTSKNLRTTLPHIFFVLADIEDDNSLSRTFCATKNFIARCSLDTQTEWAVDSILTAVEEEKMCLQKEKNSVLFTLLLFNYTRAIVVKFGRHWRKNLVFCLGSYAKHICKVLTDADRRTQFLENFSLQELLCLIEEFLIKGKVIYKSMEPTGTQSKSNSRTKNFLEGADTFSFEEASSEILVAGSIILASLCAATNHVGFIWEASYNILRFCKRDPLMVLTILHIFANLGGRKVFDSRNFDLSVMVVKSVVMFLEGMRISATSASCFPTINHLHTALCTSVACPFSEGSESIDKITSLVLEKIKEFLLEQAQQANKSSNFKSLSDISNAEKWSNREVIQCAGRMNCDVPCYLKTYLISPTQLDGLINFSMSQLSDILSLLELVASRMSWQWTSVKLVPQLFSMLDSCVVENSAVLIIVFLGHLGRFGVDVGGYEDREVENSRGSLCSYLCRDSSLKVGQLQNVTTAALFGLLPLDFKTLFYTEFSLSACSSKSVSSAAENLRKWFFRLGKDQQDLLYDFLGRN